MSGDATGKPTTAGSKPTQGSPSSRPPAPPAPPVSQNPPSVPPKKAPGSASPTSAAGATKVSGSAKPAGATKPSGASTSTGAQSAVKTPAKAASASTKPATGATTTTPPATGPSKVGTVTAATPTAVPRTSTPGVPSGAPAASTTQTSPAVKKAAAGPRRVRLAVARIDPWSAMKLSFLLSIALGIMMIVATIVFWMVLDGMYVFTEVDRLVQEVLGDTADVNVLQYVEFKRVVSLATIIAIVDMVLLTALATIGAFLYNVVASLVGGVHLTLIDE